MPKSRGRKHRPGPPPAATAAAAAQRAHMLLGQVNLGYNPAGPTKQKDIVQVSNGWSEYTLDDGTVIRTKGVLMDATRLVDQFGATGEPIYMLQLSVVHEMVVPESLKKPKPTSGTPQETEAKK